MAERWQLSDILLSSAPLWFGPTPSHKHVTPQVGRHVEVQCLLHMWRRIGVLRMHLPASVAAISQHRDSEGTVAKMPGPNARC